MSKVDWVLYVHTAEDRIRVRQSPFGTVSMACEVDTSESKLMTIKQNLEQEKSKKVRVKKKKKTKKEFQMAGPFLIR